MSNSTVRSIRFPVELHALICSAANAAGLSVNAWIVHALSDRLRGRAAIQEAVRILRGVPSLGSDVQRLLDVLDAAAVGSGEQPVAAEPMKDVTNDEAA